MAADVRPLVAFLAASLALHAALLAWLRPGPGANPGAAVTAPLLLTVVDAPAARGAAPAEPGSAPVAAPPPKPVPRHRAAAQPQPAAATPARPVRTAARRPHPAPAAVHAAPPSRPTTAAPPVTAQTAAAPQRAAAQGSLTRRLEVALTRDLGRYFRYPPLARRRGWQGQVLVALRIGPGGRIDHLRVVQSSGYPVLDRAALHSLRQVHALPQAAAWLDGQGLEMEFPVRYELLGS